jgi:hypothetical protein
MSSFSQYAYRRPYSAGNGKRGKECSLFPFTFFLFPSWSNKSINLLMRELPYRAARPDAAALSLPSA